MQPQEYFTCCKDCVFPIRHIGCHGTCEKYLAERKAYLELKQKQEKRDAIDRLLFPKNRNHRT